MEVLFLDEEFVDNTTLRDIVKNDKSKVYDCVKRGNYEGVLEWNILMEMEYHSLQMEELQLFDEETLILTEGPMDAIKAGLNKATTAVKGAFGKGNATTTAATAPNAAGNNPSDPNTTKSDVKTSFGDKIKNFLKKAGDFVRKSVQNFNTFLGNFGTYYNKLAAQFTGMIKGNTQVYAPNYLTTENISKGAKVLEKLGNLAREFVNGSNDANFIQNKAGELDGIKNEADVIIREVSNFNYNDEKNFTQEPFNNVWGRFTELEKMNQSVIKLEYSFNSVLANKQKEADAKASSLDQNVAQQAQGVATSLARMTGKFAAIQGGIYNSYIKMLRSYKSIQQAPDANAAPTPATTETTPNQNQAATPAPNA